MEFLKTLATSEDVWGSIIGGLVGGFFTYLAVILTFKYQKRNDIPNKTSSMVKMSIEIDKQITLLEENRCAVKNDICSLDKIENKFDLVSFRQFMYLQAMHTDNVTWYEVMETLVMIKDYDLNKLDPQIFLYDDCTPADIIERLIEALTDLQTFIDEKVYAYREKLE